MVKDEENYNKEVDYDKVLNSEKFHEFTEKNKDRKTFKKFAEKFEDGSFTV